MKKIVERTDIAKKLIELRKEHGLNATEAANLIGINHNNYRKYETKVTPKSDVPSFMVFRWTILYAEKIMPMFPMYQRT